MSYGNFSPATHAASTPLVTRPTVPQIHVYIFLNSLTIAGTNLVRLGSFHRVFWESKIIRERQCEYFQGYPMVSFIAIPQASFSCSLVHTSLYWAILEINAFCLHYTLNSARFSVITFAFLDIKPY